MKEIITVGDRVGIIVADERALVELVHTDNNGYRYIQLIYLSIYI